MSKCDIIQKDTGYACKRCAKVWAVGSGARECSMDHLMVDLETLGNGPRSVITQIGACYFNMDGEVGAKFEANINIQSALDVGLIIDGDTIKWWFDQPNPTWLKDTDKIVKVLSRFGQFCHGVKHVWSHATFDMPIIFNAYRECDVKIPFHYRTPRDIRTLTWLHGGDYKELKKRFPQENKHDALSDCLHQVKYVSHCYKDIKK